MSFIGTFDNILFDMPDLFYPPILDFMPAWHFLPSLSAWKGDMYNISEALEIQAPSPFTCYEGHCND